MNYLIQAWPWYVSGPIIALIMFFMLWFGKRFGMSSNLRTLCSIGGAGKFSDYFKDQFRANSWNLWVVLGALIGGILAIQLFPSEARMDLSAQTVVELQAYGFTDVGNSLLPEVLFGDAALRNPKNLAILILGGFMVGFGARYAGGCTSGHAISGLSNLQWPSLLAVIGFFAGGLLMTWIVMPYLF
ncbi:MAG: YeeE/YedE family protein [Flavobacteriaceae bacterium]|nr:YeeE/YedE family protein [Flavobacteriaceae bacterium]